MFTFCFSLLWFKWSTGVLLLWQAYVYIHVHISYCLYLCGFFHNENFSIIILAGVRYFQHNRKLWLCEYAQISFFGNQNLPILVTPILLTSVRQKCICMVNKHGSPYLSVPVYQPDVGIVCTNIPIHSTMGCTNKLIYTAYTSPLLDWYVLLVPGGTLLYGKPNKLMNLFGKYKNTNKISLYFNKIFLGILCLLLSSLVLIGSVRLSSSFIDLF